MSHRKPGGQILPQLNHQDSLQISKVAASVPCAASPGALALAVGWGGTECLADWLIIPKGRLIGAGLVVRDMQVLKYF